MEVLVGNDIDGRISRQASQGEGDGLIKKDNAPCCPGLRSFFSSSVFRLFEASACGASVLASALPLAFGNRVCDTSQFAFGSPLSIAAFVVMPVSLLGFIGSGYLRHSDENSQNPGQNDTQYTDVGAHFFGFVLRRKSQPTGLPRVFIRDSYEADDEVLVIAKKEKSKSSSDEESASASDESSAEPLKVISPPPAPPVIPENS